MRQILVLVGTAMAVLALAPASALAATEVRDSSTGDLCPEVSPAIDETNADVLSKSTEYASGGCTVDVLSDQTHDIGPDTYGSGLCDIEFKAYIGPDGWGYADDFAFAGSDCNVAGSCDGSRVITPPDYNPTFGGMLPNGIFKYADGDTDLNMSFCAVKGTSDAWGMESLDISHDVEDAELVWEDQQTDPPHASFFGYYHVGSWVSDDDIVITHD